MNKPQWYVADHLQSLVLCQDRQEAEEIVSANMARYPLTGPWRVALMVEIDIPNPPDSAGSQPAPAAAGVDDEATVDRAALAKAHRLASLHGSLDSALSSPVLATCLRNIVHAHQADPNRPYGLAADGETVYILTPPPAGKAHLADAGLAPRSETSTHNQTIDRMRLAAGDGC